MSVRFSEMTTTEISDEAPSESSSVLLNVFRDLVDKTLNALC